MKAKTKTAPESETSDDQGREEKRRLFWRRIMRRAVGGIVVFLALAVIWRLGDDTRAPSISPIPPPETVLEEVRAEESILAAGQELQQAEEFIPSDVPPPAAEQEVTSETLKEEGQEESQVQEESREELEEESREESQKELESEESLEEETKVAESEPVSPWEVQIGAFLQRSKAEQISGNLVKHGIKMRIEKVDRNGVFLFRVRASGYQKRAEAEVARQEIWELGYKNAQVRDNR